MHVYQHFIFYHYLLMKDSSINVIKIRLHIIFSIINHQDQIFFFFYLNLQILIDITIDLEVVKKIKTN